MINQKHSKKPYDSPHRHTRGLFFRDLAGWFSGLFKKRPTPAVSGASTPALRTSLVPGGSKPLLVAIDILLLAATVCSAILCIFITTDRGSVLPITLTIDGLSVACNTAPGTVEDVLTRNDVSYDKNDLIEPALNEPVVEGMDISLTRAFPVAIESGSHVTLLKMTSGTVGDALTMANVTYDVDDELSSLAFEDIYPGMQIRHTDVEIQYATTHRVLNYVEEIIKDPNEFESFKKTEQQGSDGEKRITQRITVKNGTEISRETVDQTVLTPAINEIVRIGTKIRYQTSYKGEWRRYMDKPVAGKNGWVAIKVYRITAYCTGTRTSQGTKPKLGTIAVNPKLIPYGTKIWVPGYGLGTALDTGAFRNYPEPRNNAIDLWFNSKSEAVHWGSKYDRTILIKKG
ncbi:MAG: G5 domain-containing protein [Clostridia bacterium]